MLQNLLSVAQKATLQCRAEASPEFTLPVEEEFFLVVAYMALTNN